jgi:hypothetical protein
MSNKIKQKKSKWGGFRKDSGRNPRRGGTAKICVSVHERNWNTALKRWKKKPSWLVDLLVLSYVKRGSAVLEMETAI